MVLMNNRMHPLGRAETNQTHPCCVINTERTLDSESVVTTWLVCGAMERVVGMMMAVMAAVGGGDVVAIWDNDITRLQALVDKKKVVVTEAAIREVLRLDDTEGVHCLPNEEIFAELARMGYEKPSTKLTFYKSFFSSQKQVGDLSTHTTKYTSLALTQKVFANMRRVGKGFLGVETPLFEGMIVGQVIKEGGDAKENVQYVTDGDTAQGDDTAAYGEVPTVSQEPSIPSPTPPTLPPQPPQDLPSTSQVQHTLPQSPQAQPQPQPQPQQAADFLMSLLQEALDALILKGDSPVLTRVIEGVVQPVRHTSAEQKLARRNELKARGTLLMALPDKHQL
nr:hypothetical protein [Tanacetum cinerariifolium]